MFAHLSIFLLLLAFAAAGAAVWVAGIYLSNTTSVLAARFGLGQALGGLLLLAVVTNLPELAITVSAALSQHLELAIGNILGGIAMQTLVLVVLDVFGLGKKAALTYRAASLVLVLEGVLVLAVLAVVLVGSQLPASVIVARVPPAELLILVLWVAGLWLIGKAQKGLPWQAHDATPPGDQPQKPAATQALAASTTRTVLVFLASAGVTLVAGVVLERSGNALATHWGMSGLLFGATVLAAATSLPEVSTGLASMKSGDYQLAISDIFGGNAFLPVLFLVASVLSGKATLPHAGKADLYLTGVGMLLTCVYIYGLVFRPQRQVARMGLDSLLVLGLYGLGMLGLLAISH